MKLIITLIVLAAGLHAQQSLSSPATVGGLNCGEIRLREAFSSGAEYMAFRNCEEAGEMGIRLENSAGQLKARFGNAASGSFGLYNSAQELGAFLSASGSFSLYGSGVLERIRINTDGFRSWTPAGFDAIRTDSSSGYGLARWFNAGSERVRVDASGTGGLVTSAGNELVLEQTGDAVGFTRFRLRNRFAENGIVVEVGAVDLADIILRGSSGAQRNI